MAHPPQHKQNAIRIAENQSNPAHEVIFQPKCIDLYESEPNFIKFFGVRILPVLESANINFITDKTFTPNVPAWCINKPKRINGITLFRAKGHRTIKTTKRKSWGCYVLKSIIQHLL